MIDDRAGAREEFFAVTGAQLYLREIGHGAPLVILHGGPDFNHHYLLPEMDRLASHFRLIYYDQRGRGRSSAKVAPGDVTIESEVDDLDRLRRHLGVDSVALLGHSWGGLLAMEYTVRDPARVSHLVLMNSAPASHRDMTHFRSQRAAHHPEEMAKMRAIASTREYLAGDVEVEAEYYRTHFSAALDRPELIDVVVGRLRTHFAPADILKAREIEERLYAQTWNLPEYDLLPGLRNCRAHTLLIHGEKDLFPAQCVRNVADAIPDATLVILRDCGHFAYLEQPDDVACAIAGHLL